MIKGGPKIINDGLVLCLDAHDAKSYAGEPVTNLYGDMSTSQGLRPNRTEYNTGGTWPTDMPMCPEPVGRVYKHTSGALTSSWSGNSYGYMYKDISTTSGLMYTLTFWIYLSPDCDIDYMQASIEGATSNYGAWTGYPQQYDFTKKGTWQLLSRHATADTNVRFLIYPGHTGVTDGSFSGFFAWGGMQVVQAEHVTPFVLSSRSATNGWVDRTTNNNDGTLVNGVNTGVSHYRDGQVIMPVANSYLDFDGSDDRVDVAHSTQLNNAKTWEIWINMDSIPASNTFKSIFQKSANWNNNGGILLSMIYGNLRFSYGGSWGDLIIESLSNLSTNTWYQVVGTGEDTGAGILMKGYLNGVFKNSDTRTGAFIPTNTNTLFLGYGNGGYMDGKIGLVRVYNGILTAAEVLSNYNATKGRF